MADSSENWSEQRRITAQRIAAILYGVVAIMTAELAVRPDKLSQDKFGHAEAALGALLVGLAMTVTDIFVETVTKEAEIGAHLRIVAYGAIVRDSLLVMLFPVIAALLILVTAFTTVQWTVLLDGVRYLGMATVFAVGFLSSYVLDRRLQRALSRGIAWLLLSLVLVAAKSLS